jgi:hypothetical protein
MLHVRGRTWLCVLGAVVGLYGCSFDARYAQTATEPADSGIAPADAGTTPPPPARDASTSTANRPDARIGTGSGPSSRPGSGTNTDWELDAAAGNPSHDAEPDIDPSPACPTSLEQRLTVSTIGTGVDIRYKRLGYDYFPLDENILFSVSPAGRMLLAYRENNGNRIRVTRLNAQLTREGPDLSVYAIDLGGLVAHDDGSFTLLTRRDDPGEPLRDTTTTDTVGKAAYLVHILGTTELFAQPLTGTSSITRASDPMARDCAPSLNGRLVWNGSKYGAYFAVHGCEGDPHEPYYGDKLVYADGDGNYLKGGWSWNCSISQGVRLLPERDKFTALCMSDGLPYAGLNLVTEGIEPRQLAPEKVAAGYAAGRFGSVVRLASGRYVIAWLSRGVPDTVASARRPDQASKQATDVALMQLDSDYSTIKSRTWLTETPNVAETNLHIAPYGPRQLLVVYDNVEALSCTEWTCWGTYTGTSARLIDLNGKFLTPDLRIDAPPNSEQDIVVFPNGDLGWAFVPDGARNYTEPLPNNRGIPTVPAKQQLSIARLRYCE